MAEMNAFTVDDATVKRLQDAGFAPVLRWVRPFKSERAYKTKEALATIEPRCDATFTGDQCVRQKGHRGMHEHPLPDGGKCSWRDKHVLPPKKRRASERRGTE